MRFWLEDHRRDLGLVLAVAIAGGLWLIFDPYYPPKSVTGQVVEPTVMTRRKSVVGAVDVVVDGRRARVHAPLRYGCDVGDEITLQKLGVRWGYSYSLALVPDPCTPPPFRN